MELKQIRQSLGMTQAEAAEYFQVSLRSYKEYENSPEKQETLKYKYMCEKLEESGRIDEEHGMLTIEKIKEIVFQVCREYDVEYCYLFGSYAKGLQNEKSDVDLLISSNVTGMRFFGLAERLRSELKKKVDLLSVEQLKDNIELTKIILKEGVKIYEK